MNLVILVNLVIFGESGDSTEFCDFGDSGDSGDCDKYCDSGESGDFGESDDSCESGKSGESSESGKFANVVENGPKMVQTG